MTKKETEDSGEENNTLFRSFGFKKYAFKHGEQETRLQYYKKYAFKHGVVSFLLTPDFS